MTGWTTEYISGKPRLAVDRMGEGPLVLFLHGIGGNRTNWHDQLPAFAAHYNAVAWDGRGYGLSDDYDGPLDFADFAADVLRVLDHYGAETAHIVGLSMGGRIAQDLHARHPERIATLVLCDTFPAFTNDFTPAQRAEFVRLRKEPLLAGKEPKDIAPVVAKTLAGPNIPPEIFARLVASMSALHKQSYLKTIEATTMYDRTANLADIKVPTLLVFGGADSLTTPEIGRRMEAAIPGSRLFVIEGAGHLCNIEEPDIFNKEVLAFLAPHRQRAH